MAYLDNTRAHSGREYELTLCLTADEVKILLPHFEKALERSEKMYLKYKDIHEGGEATTVQENALMRYEDEVNALKSVVGAAEGFIN